jgi:peroxiredoxin Q/BCP
MLDWEWRLPMRLLVLLAAATGLAVGALAQVRAAAEDLKPGDPAPAFSLVGSDGKTYRLSDFNGKQAVVLAWFPKAFTGG